MKIIEVVEPLVSLVLIGGNRHVNDEDNFVFCVTEQYLEAVKNLEFLGRDLKNIIIANFKLFDLILQAFQVVHFVQSNQI